MNNRVFLLIENLNMSQSEFAQATGVSPSALTQLKNSNGNLSIDNVMKITKAFPNISLEWLISGEGQMWKHTEDSGEPNLFSNSEVNNSISNNYDAKTAYNYTQKIQGKQQNKNSIDSIAEKIVYRKVKKIIIFYDDGKFDEFNM